MTMGPIAQEIEGAIAHLLDPKTKWVQHAPRRPGEACVVYRYGGEDAYKIVSIRTMWWLDSFMKTAISADFADEYGIPSIVEFNDRFAKSRRDVWLLLDEALTVAIEDGV